MKEREMKNERNQSDSAENEIGDVEMAGETTAAAAISGPTNTKPVGADTMIKVADTDDKRETDDD
jgi:hypothetical protein